MAGKRQAVSGPSKAEFEAVFIFSVLGQESASVHVTGQILVHICRFPTCSWDKSLQVISHCDNLLEMAKNLLFQSQKVKTP